MLALNFNDTHANQGGAFIQDTWTRDRLTLRYGARFDKFTASYPAHTLGPTLFTPGRNVQFPAAKDLLHYTDHPPRSRAPPWRWRPRRWRAGTRTGERR